MREFEVNSPDAPLTGDFALVAPESMRIARFGESCMVFNPLSWETHYGSAHVADILDALAGDVTSGAELVDRLLGDAPDPGESAALFRLLSDLVELGLVRSAGGQSVICQTN